MRRAEGRGPGRIPGAAATCGRSSSIRSPSARTASGSNMFRPSTMIGLAIRSLDPGQVERPEFLPLRADEEGVRACAASIGVLAVDRPAGDFAGRSPSCCPWPWDRKAGRTAPSSSELPDDLDARRLADVVGLGLEGQAEDGDLLVLEDPERAS